VAAVAGTGTPLVVVLVNGRPLAVPEVVERADAVVEAWLPGCEGGHAIADVLGGADPGGRLPVSLPRSVGQVPVGYARTPASAAEYVVTPGDPLFPFGHGESYAAFAYRSLAVDDAVPTDGTVTATVEVANVGDVPGEEVVQFYARDEAASVVRPVRELVAFRRLSLAPGEAATVRAAVPTAALAFHDADGRPTVEPGTVTVEAARSAGDVRLTGAVDLVGDVHRPADPTRLADVTVE
jgi:beta-glucosidase